MSAFCGKTDQGSFVLLCSPIKHVFFLYLCLCLFAMKIGGNGFAIPLESTVWFEGWFKHRFVAVNRPQKIQHASRKPFAVGWLTRAHPQHSARTRYWTRTHHTSPQGRAWTNSQSAVALPANGCRQALLSKRRARMHACKKQARHNSHFFLI